MRKDALPFLRAEFLKYVKSFYSEDRDVQLHVTLKEQHTLRVVQHAAAIANSLGLLSHDLLLAEIAALFHDMGRFKQYQRYHTFNDARSVDHAALGVQELIGSGLLAQAGLSPTEQQLIEKAVLYHNKRCLPEEEKKGSLLWAQILRDADKLDIFHIIVSEEMPQSPELKKSSAVSPKVIQDILQGKMARFEDVATAADQMLFRLSWLYNIYFPYTFQYILDCEYIDKMFNLLSPVEELKPVYRHLQKYAQNKSMLGAANRN